MTMVVSKTGTFSMQYELNGVDITASINSAGIGPQAFVVSSGQCKANKIVVPNLSDAVVFNCKEGDNCSFSITCRDVLDNTLTQGGDSI